MHATSWCARVCLGLAMAAAWNAAPAPGQVVINEFLPDPAGADGGHEFVELLNTGPQAVELAGWQLQFANGAEVADWQVRWTGQPGQTLGAGARFLIVDRNWTGAVTGQAEVALALQNGPDAIRLVTDGIQRDLVGYGPLTDPALMEAAPAPVSAGRSLARRPDGRDSDDNRADFVAAEPSPGAVNFALHALTVVECQLEPPSLPAPGATVTVSALVRNDGLEPLPTTRISLTCGQQAVPAILDATDSGDERRLAWTLRPAALGRWPLRLSVPLADAAETLRVELVRLQVGPAELILSEALAAPRSGQGEWLELAATGSAPAELGSYRLRDDDSDWTTLPAIRLAAGQRLVAAQDSLSLDGWLAANAAGPADARGCGAALLQLSPWPSLNNTPPDGRDHADRVLLADSTGTVIDHVVIGDAGTEVAADRSLERVDGSMAAGGWAECLAAAGATPGCANSVAAPPGAGGPVGALTAVPALADREAGLAAIHLSFTVPDAAAGWDLEVFDLDGRQVRDLGGDSRSPGPRALLWDLRDDHSRPVAAGGYVAVLCWRDGSGRPAASSRCLLVVR